VREWNLQEKLRRQEDTRGRREERAKEAAAAANALLKECVRSACVPK
jgi:hypothetical protein